MMPETSAVNIFAILSLLRFINCDKIYNFILHYFIMLFYHTFTPPQDISVRVSLTFTGLGETLSLPVGKRGNVVLQ